MTALCHTVHRVSPHQAERERDGDRPREGEKVVMEKNVRDLSKVLLACMH